MVEHVLLQFTYPAIFLLLVASGMGLPISEDVILISTGALAARGLCNPAWASLAAYLGLVTGDFALFNIGRKLGRRALESRRVQKLLPPARVQAVESRFARWGPWAVFAARFMAGLRIATFLSAGVMDVPRRRFLLADATAAALWVPGVIYLSRAGATLVNAQTLPLLRTVLVAAGLGLFAGVLARLLAREAPGAIVAADRELEDAGP